MTEDTDLVDIMPMIYNNKDNDPCERCGKNPYKVLCMDGNCLTNNICGDCSVKYNGTNYCKAHMIDEFNCPLCEEKMGGFLENEMGFYKCCKIPICPRCDFEPPEVNFICPCGKGDSSHEIEIKHTFEGAWYICREYCKCYKSYLESEKTPKIMKLESQKRKLESENEELKKALIAKKKIKKSFIF